MVLGMMGSFKSKVCTLTALSLVFVTFLAITTNPPKPEMNYIYNDFAMLGGYSFYPIPFFLLGSLFYVFRAQVFISGYVAIGLCAAYLALRGTALEPYLLYPAFIYGVLYLCHAPLLRRLDPKHDYSYGIYIYAFPLSQAANVAMPDSNFWVANGVAMLLILVFSALSWHLIERPALNLARRIGSLRPLSPAYAPAIGDGKIAVSS